ncbi:secretion protein HylD [Methyloceanibacter methanicus]|uniref:Secretion protein HylD n=1 Tax=Methyloceanibacter methanicus TaxID=1774968 RepID=A0A1E3W590_9HYPH|nr:HlyD family secretion protein [Methyloceanibacter methanicus]ODS00672.1 secretion protein HylD [Methyloceanibacter methanicus]
MELLLILTYAAICVAIFKIFRIPVNKWTLPTAVLGGIFMIGFILVVMNYNHPFSANARVYFTTTPILPDVRGRVIEVPVKANEPLKQGDVLFRIDPTHYQYIVDQKKALLAEAEQDVKELKSAYDQALANVQKVKAQVTLAQENYDRQLTLFEKDVIAKATLDKFTRDVDIAKQALSESEAAATTAKLAYESEVGGVNTTVARLTAELGEAEYDLAQTVVRAPGPGYVTQMVLRPGMYVVPAPLRPVMVFVHSDDQSLAAGFHQNSLQRVRAGDEAEVAFQAIPGRVFKGKVRYVLDSIATGQLQASGVLQDMGAPPPGGRAVAIVDVDEDASDYKIPGGAAAQVAVYTPYAHHFAIIRKILLRMRSWQNFVFLEGHGGGGGGH